MSEDAKEVAEMINRSYPKTWAEESNAEELRFVLWGIPHVIKRQDQYLVCMQGLPPQRKIIHLSVIGRIGKQPDGSESVVEWVKRSGIFGLMSTTESENLSERLKVWWTQANGNETK